MKHRTLVYLSILINITYLIWRCFYTLPLGYGNVVLILAFLLILSELTAFFELMVNFFYYAILVIPKYQALMILKFGQV